MNAREINAAAEARYTEGHHTLDLREGGWAEVSSASTPGKTYRVEFWGTTRGEPIVFTCRPEAGGRRGEGHGDVRRPGVVPCKHAAGVALLLAENGLAARHPIHGWVATAKAQLAAPPAAIEGDELFEGLT